MVPTRYNSLGHPWYLPTMSFGTSSNNLGQFVSKPEYLLYSSSVQTLVSAFGSRIFGICPLRICSILYIYIYICLLLGCIEPRMQHKAKRRAYIYTFFPWRSIVVCRVFVVLQNGTFCRIICLLADISRHFFLALFCPFSSDTICVDVEIFLWWFLGLSFQILVVPPHIQNQLTKCSKKDSKGKCI